MPKKGRPYSDREIEVIFRAYLYEEHPYSADVLGRLAERLRRTPKQISFVMRWFKPGVPERMPIKARNRIMRQAAAVRTRFQAQGLIPEGT